MNKKQAGSSAGSLALLALLVHMFGGSPDSRPSSVSGVRKEGSSSASGGKGAAVSAFEGEGPWLATQQYFHRAAQKDEAAKCGPYLLPGPGQDESPGCARDALLSLYGMDKDVAASQLTALIATIPDPLHTRMSLETDRYLDAIQQAAYSAHWELATQWLPWTVKGAEANSGDESGPGLDPEKLPGLIVFRQHFTEARLEKKLLLIFVVGETPTAGINGFQFEIARRSIFTLGSDHPGHVAILGPNFSGSFQSLTRLIQTDRSGQSYEVRSGGASNLRYASSMVDALSSMGDKFSFHGSMIPSRSFRADFRDLVKDWNYKPEQAAELIEDESGFAFKAPDIGEHRNAKSGEVPIRTYRYPRDISQLRNAYSDIAFDRSAKQDGTPVPALEFSLKDTQSGEDVFPIFSSSHTAVSQNAVMEQVVRSLKRDGVRVVSLSATNIFDTLFLSRVLTRYCPDTRIVLSDADLLYVDNANKGALTGVMAISSFPLFPAGERWTNPKRYDITTFPDAASEGEYNAAMALLNGPLEKREAFAPGSGHDANKLLSTWLLVLGRSGWYPVSLIDEGNISLQVGKNGAARNWFDQTSRGPTRKPLPQAEESWIALCIAVAILSIGFCARMYYLRFHPRLLVWSSLCLSDLPGVGCPRAITELEHLRYLCLFGCLSVLTFIAGIPLLPMVAAWTVHDSPVNGWLLGALVFLAIAAPVVTAGYLCWLVPVRICTEASRGFGERSAAAIVYRAAILLAPVAGLACWWTCCANGTEGRLLCYRALTLAAPVCPIWPLLLSGLALLAVVFFHLRRFTWGDRQQPLLDTQVFDEALWGQFQDLKSRLDCVLRSPATAFRPSGIPVVPMCVAGFIFVLILLFPSDTLRSFEPGIFKDLLIGMLLPVAVGLTLSFAQFASCWSTIRAFLATLNSVVLGRFFSRLPDFGGSGPVWLRHVKLMSLATSVNSSIALHNLQVKSGSDEEYGTRYWTALQEFLSSQQAGRSRREYIAQYAKFRRTAAEITDALGKTILKPYWAANEIGFVDTDEPETERKRPEANETAMAAGAGRGSFSTVRFALSVAAVETEPARDAVPQISEEAYKLASRYVALQYAAFIGYALRQLQNLLLCCTATFVLLVLALSSFSFQAPQAISQFLIMTLIAGGAIVLAVLAQMEKDAILSRLSGSTEGELGKAFYIRALTYGAVPVLAVLGTRFPAIASFLSTWAEPTLSAMR